MISIRTCFAALIAAALVTLGALRAQDTGAKNAAPSKSVSESGNSLFQQNCAFCHGRDAGGGETGPDLTRSKIVAEDVAGNKIGLIIRNGIADKGMPKFALPDNDVAALVAFIHAAKLKAESQKGGRRGVDTADLQTGDAAAGKRYFEGAGGCARCHSTAGDLAGLATRHQGLELEQRMLYPRNAAASVTVTLPNGKVVKGKLAHRDEFTVALREASGRYRSWFAADVKFAVDAPAEAHAELLSKYTDGDIHDLVAYLQTLR